MCCVHSGFCVNHLGFINKRHQYYINRRVAALFNRPTHCCSWPDASALVLTGVCRSSALAHAPTSSAARPVQATFKHSCTHPWRRAYPPASVPPSHDSASCRSSPAVCSTVTMVDTAATSGCPPPSCAGVHRCQHTSNLGHNRWFQYTHKSTTNDTHLLLSSPTALASGPCTSVSARPPSATGPRVATSTGCHEGSAASGGTSAQGAPHD